MTQDLFRPLRLSKPVPPRSSTRPKRVVRRYADIDQKKLQTREPAQAFARRDPVGFHESRTVASYAVHDGFGVDVERDVLDEG